MPISGMGHACDLFEGQSGELLRGRPSNVCWKIRSATMRVWLKSLRRDEHEVCSSVHTGIFCAFIASIRGPATTLSTQARATICLGSTPVQVRAIDLNRLQAVRVNRPYLLSAKR